MNAVELVGTTIQIEGAIKCLQDLTSALNSSKRKALLGKFPPSDFPPEGGRDFSPHTSPHLGPQLGPGQIPPGVYNPLRPQLAGPPKQGQGPWPPRPGGEYPPYPPHLTQGQGQGQGQGQPMGQTAHLNARDQMLAREQLQLQRLYAHSTGGAQGGNSPHSSNLTPRLGPQGSGQSLGQGIGSSQSQIFTPGQGLGPGPGPGGLTSSPRVPLSVAPPSIGNRYSLALPTAGSPRAPGVSPGSTTLSATAAPFVFGQASQTPPSANTNTTAGAAFLRSSNPVNGVEDDDVSVRTGGTDNDINFDVTNQATSPLSSSLVPGSAVSGTTAVSAATAKAAYDMGMTYNFELETNGPTPNISVTSASAEEGEVEAMSRRFLTGLDEDMNFCLDTYSGFEEPYMSFDGVTNKENDTQGSFSLRSSSPENPVLGDSGWDVSSGNEEMFPPSPVRMSPPRTATELMESIPIRSPTSLIQTPLLTPTSALPSPLPDSLSLTDDITDSITDSLIGLTPGPGSILTATPTPSVQPPTIPVTVQVPVVISPSIVIPQSTARFTGFTAVTADDESVSLSNPFASGGPIASPPPPLPTVTTTATSALLPETPVNLGVSTGSMFVNSGSQSVFLKPVGPVGVEDRERTPLSATSLLDPIANFPLKITETVAVPVKESTPSLNPSARIDWPFSKIGLLQGASGASIIQDIMENTHTDITVDFGGPPGLPRKVSISGTREADVGLANVLLSDVMTTGSYISFKESSGDIPLPLPLQQPIQIQPPVGENRENSTNIGVINGTNAVYDNRNRSDSFNPPGGERERERDLALNFLNQNRAPEGPGQGPGSGIGLGASTYSSLLASHRDVDQRERERYSNSTINFDPRGGYQGSQLELERERERERIAAGRLNPNNPGGPGLAPGSGQGSGPPAQQQTSRYPRLFPSASGGAVPISPSAQISTQVRDSGILSNIMNQGVSLFLTINLFEIFNE